jgi:hypothetical protein
VAQGLGTDAADSRIPPGDRGDALLAPGLDAGKLQLLSKDLGQFLQRDLHLENVLPGLVPGGPVAVPFNGCAGITITLAYAGFLVAPVVELGQFDLWEGDADDVPPLPADHLPAGNVFLQVPLDLAPDNLIEPGFILVDLSNHICSDPMLVTYTYKIIA